MQLSLVTLPACLVLSVKTVLFPGMQKALNYDILAVVDTAGLQLNATWCSLSKEKRKKNTVYIFMCSSVKMRVDFLISCLLGFVCK